MQLSEKTEFWSWIAAYATQRENRVLELDCAYADRKSDNNEGDKQWKIIFLIKSMKSI